MNNKNAAPSASLTIGELVRMQEHIADQLDHFKYCFEQSIRVSSEGKISVVMLGAGYAAIAGGFTPDEIKEALERIVADRDKRTGKKLVAETVLNDSSAHSGSIQSARLGNSITNTSYSIRVEVDGNSKPNASGMGSGWALDKLGVFENTPIAAKIQEEMKERRAASDQLSIDAGRLNAATSTKIKLSDEMRDAVVDAVTNSGLFESFRTELNGQAASIAILQQAINNAVNEAISNALRPGGIVWSALGR